MNAVTIAHRDTKTWSDYVALAAIKTLRWGMDVATGYKHDEAVSLGQKDPKVANKKVLMDERKYMILSLIHI